MGGMSPSGRCTGVGPAVTESQRGGTDAYEAQGEVWDEFLPGVFPRGAEVRYIGGGPSLAME